MSGPLSKKPQAGSSAVSVFRKTGSAPACAAWSWATRWRRNTGEENLASQRIIEKCGFQYEGTLRRIYRIYDGTVKPVRCYTMLREEYDGLRQAGVL